MKRIISLAVMLALTMAIVVFPTKASGEPLIVILPGIMGSELSDEEGKIWPPFDFSTLMDDTQDVLSIQEILSNAARNFDKLGYRFGKSLPSISAVQNYGTMGTYGPLADALNQSYETVVFCYDWRQANSDSAEQLAEFLSQYEGRDITLVAHSMGGLVAAEYVRAHPTSISKVITLGTPYLGSEDASKTAGQMLAGGNEQTGEFINFLVGGYINNLMESMPSIKELKPHESFDLPSSTTEWYAIYGTSAGDGDGTVTSNSATNAFTIQNFPVSESHGGLASNWTVLDAILKIIDTGKFPITDVLSPDLMIDKQGMFI